MKKLALALCLAATLTACETPLRSAAATAEVAPRLPNTVLGHWCFSRAPEDDPWLISSADNFDDCANRGGARFWRRDGKWGFQLGRFDWRSDCEISKIERVPSKGPKVYRVHSYCRAKREMFVGDPLKGAKLFELWQSKTGLHWRELEPATRFDKYECRVTEAVEDISTGNSKTLTPEYDRVLIEVAQNPPRMKVSHVDKKGRAAERNKQYQDGSYVLLSTEPSELDTEEGKEFDAPVFTLYGSRTVGSTIYRIVGKMTLYGTEPRYYDYYEEIHKDGYLDATIRAGNCSEKKQQPSASTTMEQQSPISRLTPNQAAAVPGPTEPPQPFDPAEVAARFKELARIMHHAARFCTFGDLARAPVPSGLIGVRPLAVQRVWS